MAEKKPNQIYAAFADPDQDKILKELEICFGHNSKRYLDSYEKMRTAWLNKPSSYLYGGRFNFAALFASFAWYFYRKMFLIGSAIVIMPILLKFLFGNVLSSGFDLWVAFFFARRADAFYVSAAIDRLQKSKTLGFSDEERLEYLKNAGDVSVAGGAFGGFIYIMFFYLSFVIAMQAHKHS